MDVVDVSDDELTNDKVIHRKDRKTGAYEKEFLSEEKLNEKILQNLED